MTREEKILTGLQNKNEKLRNKVDRFLSKYISIAGKESYKGEDEYERFWEIINNLIENELQQEELCGE